MEKSILVVHSDGGARGNPGPAACAFIAEEKGKLIYRESKFLGQSTNNFAEYQGVILALNWLIRNPQTTSQVVFYLDSELVVKQLNGLYKVKSMTIKNIFLEVNTRLKEIGKEITFKHIPRSKNKIADVLVNRELDKTLE